MDSFTPRALSTSTFHPRAPLNHNTTMHNISGKCTPIPSAPPTGPSHRHIRFLFDPWTCLTRPPRQTCIKQFPLEKVTESGENPIFPDTFSTPVTSSPLDLNLENCRRPLSLYRGVMGLAASPVWRGFIFRPAAPKLQLVNSRHELVVATSAAAAE